MLRRTLVSMAILVFAAPACAASYYSDKPDDPTLLVLTKDQFPGLHADGINDDSDILQQAITQAGAQAHVLLVPQARYLISKTIAIPPSTRVLGFGKERPVFTLGADTPGYDTNTPKYMIWFSGGSGRRQNRDAAAANHFSDASPGTFYSGLSNIDFDIQEGNPAAVAIRGHFAQHGIITHVDFKIGSGFAGMDEVGNEAEDLHFHGGDYGIVTTGTSPSWQFTLLDSSFDGQRIAAFKTRHTGLTLVRDQFQNLPTAIAIDENQSERLWMKECRLLDISGPALVIGEENNVRTAINLEDIVCQNVPQVALYRQSNKTVPSDAGDNYLIKHFNYGLQITDLGDSPIIKQTYESQPLTALPAPVATDIPALPPMETWTNITKFGAKGDGIADDLPAFNAAIAQAKVIFIPHGRYKVTDTIQLKPDTILIGLNPITTQIGIEDNEKSFTGDGGYKAVIEAPHAGTNIITGIGIDSGADNSRAVGLQWMAGETSMVNDVKFLGGHGTGRPDRKRAPIYNGDHTGDGDPSRKWDSEGPGLWITDGGGGTFANIWTASTFSSSGMLIEKTATPGRIYELSSEHHVRNEIIMRNVSNWNIDAQQTEEEWGEGAKCLPLEIDNCSNLTFANTIFFRVFGMSEPYPYGAKIADSHNIRFLGVRTYGQSAYNFDNPLFDSSLTIAVRSREIGLVNISGNPPQPIEAISSPIIAPGATLEKLPATFISPDHAITDSTGNAYFVDLHQNKIFTYSPDSGQLTVLRDDPIQPFALAIDHSENLLILSHLGKAYSLPLKDPHAPLTELTNTPAAPQPGLTAFLPADRWWDSGMFVETNARREPLQFISPDHSVFIPVPADFNTGRQHNWTSQPIDLYRGYQLAPAEPNRPFYVADENEYKTWLFTPADDGTLTNPHLFAQHGEAGVAADANGNVYIAEGEIFVYDSKGNPIDLIRVPDRPLSLVFCGKDRQTLLITARGGVYALKMSVKGQ